MLASQFQKLSQGLYKALFRFWPVLLISLSGTIIWIWYSQLPYEEQEAADWVEVWMISGTFGMPFLTACLLWLEKEKSRRLRLPVLLLAFVLVILYGLLMPSADTPLRLFTHLLLFSTALLFISFTRFRASNSQLWSYNKKAIEALLMALLYSIFLMLSLSLLFYSIEILFQAELSENTYQNLFVVIAYFIGPALFLAFLPGEAGASQFPAVLRYFCYYLLTPVAILYLLVLYGYMFKILLIQEWPEGLVALPVLGFALLGMALYLFTFPLTKEQLPALVRAFRKAYFYLLIPLLFLMGAGTQKRINEYGLTEERFLLALITLWLFGICLYFILKKTIRLFYLPLSLSLLLLAAAITAYPLSRLSQFHRFQQLLKANSLSLPVRQIPAELEEEEQRQLSAIADYFSRRKDLYFLSSKLRLTTADSILTDSQCFIEHIGLAYIHPWQTNGTEPMFYSARAKRLSLLPIGEWKYLLDIEATNSPGEQQMIEQALIEQHSLYIRFSEDTLHFDLRPIVEKITQQAGKQEWLQQELQLKANGENTEGLLYLHLIDVRMENQKTEVQHLSGRVLVRPQKN